MVLHPSTPSNTVDEVLVDREAMVPAYRGVQPATDSSRLTPIGPSRRDMFRTLPPQAPMRGEAPRQHSGELDAPHGHGMALLAVVVATFEGECRRLGAHPPTGKASQEGPLLASGIREAFA
jgi:hypothetical protein